MNIVILSILKASRVFSVLTVPSAHANNAKASVKPFRSTWRRSFLTDRLSLREGAILPWQTPAYSHELQELLSIAPEFKIPVDVPVSRLKPKHWQVIQSGSPKHNFGGLDGFFAWWLERKKYKVHIRSFLARWRTYAPCDKCGGQRLNRASLAYRIDGRTFADVSELTIDQLSVFLPTIRNRTVDTSVHAGLVTEVMQRTSFRNLGNKSKLVSNISNVGLGYVALDRAMHTAEDGRIAACDVGQAAGSSLVDMLYVLDEPTVGLHPKDSKQIVDSVLRLRERGNTIVIVEHEPHLIRCANRVIEIGPQAGRHGGNKTFDGTMESFEQSNCLTSKYMNGTLRSHRTPRPLNGPWVELTGATGRNLKGVHFDISLESVRRRGGPKRCRQEFARVGHALPGPDSIAW